MARTTRGVKAFDEYLAEEFHELRKQNEGLRADISSLKDTINSWKSVFERQLDKLNTNMETVLNTIANHEARLTELETKSKAHEIEEGVWTKVKKASIGALTWLFWGALVVSAAYGVKPALKVFNLLAN